MTSVVGKATEGQYRPGPYYLPVTGGFLSAEVGQYWNFWQKGYDVLPAGARSAIVEACVSAYSQTVAMCPGDHWRSNDKGGRDRVTNSALSRVLRYPNAYQTMSDFLLNAVRQLYIEGNAYALCLRNDRYEIDELHLMNSQSSFPQIAPETGDIFYRLGGNEVIENQLKGDMEQLIVPARDVLHIRLHTDRRTPRPLVGETPLLAALSDMGTLDAMTAQQQSFYLNQARPSAVLSTDMQLDKDQVQFLRDRWNEQSSGLAQGKTPILTAGLKVVPWSTPTKDAAIAEMAKISQERIALVYRVPMAVLGLEHSGFKSTESLMQFWIATGLGFALNHVEEAFGHTFQLDGQPDDYVEFDTAALLRSEWTARIEALARGVQGGIFSPNEARNMESLPDVKYGDEPRVQQQVVPLSAASAIQKPVRSPPPDSGPPSAPPSPSPPSAPPAPQKSNSRGPPDVRREYTRRFIEYTQRHERRIG